MIILLVHGFRNLKVVQITTILLSYTYLEI